MKLLINICGISYYRSLPKGLYIIALCNFGNDMIKPRIWTINNFIKYCKTKWWLYDLAGQL